MALPAGTILQSTALLDDSIFEGVSIVITETNSDGATGFVYNKPYPRKLNELAEFSDGRPFPLYEGGPVDQEHLFFIHRRPDIIMGGQSIGKSLYLGGDFKQAVKAINRLILSENDIRIFIGYCGWDASELEAEIAEGSWTIAEENNQWIISNG